MKTIVAFAVVLGLGVVACSTKETSQGSGGTGGAPGAGSGGRAGSAGALGAGGTLGSAGVLGAAGSVGSGGAPGSGGTNTGGGGSDAGVSPMDGGDDDAVTPCKCGDLCNSCPVTAPQCPGAIAYCDRNGACVIGGPPVCASGEGGAGGQGASTGRGGSAGGTAFACDGGGGAAGASVTCQGGQTFCHVRKMKSGGAPASAACESFTDAQRRVDCSGTANCACLCTASLFFSCQTECRCSESGGHVTVTCDPV